MSKRFLTILIIVSIISTSFSGNIARASTGTTAEKLYDLGLLSNISREELNTGLNRIIGLTMVLKSIGFTDLDAENAAKSHTFKDFAHSYKWGSGWANIGVEKNITTGKSDSYFHPGELMTKKEFLTYQLRVLGYGVKESWDNCAKLSVEAGLIASEHGINSYGRFTKGQAVDILYAALSSKLKEEPEKTLANKLVEDGVIDKEKAAKQNIASLNRIEIASIKPLSNTKIEVTLKNPIYFVNNSELSLIDSYGKKLKITSSTLSEDGKIINLITEAQRTYLPHTLIGYNSSVSYNPIYRDSYRPYLSNVTVLNNTSIKLTFNEKVDKSALNIRNYSITNSLYPIKAEYEVKVQDEEEEIIESSIILTTSKQSHNIRYRITISNVYDLAGNLINSSRNSMYFTGKAEDTTKPRLYSAYAIANNKIQVNFSEEIDEESANDLTNYTIDGFTILEAERQEQKSIVYLTIFEQMDNSMKTLKVNGIKDLAGNTLNESYSTYNFWASVMGYLKPRLVRATSISDTQIRVVFNRPITDETGSMEYAYYLGEELQYPIKVEKDNYTTDGTVWILTTPSRENKTYTLVVSGVQDFAGNMIDEDYNTSTF